MVTTSNSIRWEPMSLMQVADVWVTDMRKKKTESFYRSMWWGYVFNWTQNIDATIDDFINGTFRFSPMITFRFSDQVIRAWEYKDKLILKFLRKIISPVLKYIILPCCYHLNGPTGIKNAISFIKNSMNFEHFRYFIRADIKDYYASIDRNILVQQTRKYFKDLRLCKYLKAVVTTAIDDGGEVKVPKLGIPRGSSLSPFFGALYLSGLDQAFQQNTGISYCRYMDDIIILAKTKRQFLSAKKRFQQILLSLKLKLSRSKTRMGEITKGFHFLGVNFAVSKNQQNNNKIHVTTLLHSRTIRRALDKVNAMEEGAVNPVNVQRYLSRWAAWWRFSCGLPFEVYLVNRRSG